MEEKKNPIPFGKAMRIGNYKVWRSKSSVSYTPTDEERARVREETRGKSKLVTRKFDIDIINISNLDGSWSTKIPSTCQMYSTIMLAFGQNVKDRDMFLGMVFGNMLSICTVTNVYLHDSLSFLMNFLQFPYLLLSEKEMVKKYKEGFKKDGKTDKKEVDAFIENMCKSRKELYQMIEDKKLAFIADYEAELEMAKRREESAQEDLKHDELAEQANDILNEKED